MKKFRLFFLIQFLFLSWNVFAGPQSNLVDPNLIDKNIINILKSDEDFNYPDFYQINENHEGHSINLRELEHREVQFPMPTVPYKRDVHFGGWLRDNTNESCLNTRGKVLIRDSESEVTYKPSSPNQPSDKPIRCTVEGGEWNDPYTANTYFLAKDIEIDHLVALKNAYMTGAHEWDFKKRCLYANYLGNKFHLLSVNSTANRLKSDHTPSGYIPPNEAYTCQYIKQWLHVKLIWSLRLTPKEVVAINQITSDYHCDPQSFEVSRADLEEQREFMAANADLCRSNSVLIEKF